MNALIGNNKISNNLNRDLHVYRHADSVIKLTNGSHEIYRAIKLIFNQTLSYILFFPFSIVLRALLSYLKFLIKKDVKNYAIIFDDSIQSFENLRARHARLCKILKDVDKVMEMSKDSNIPLVIKFALSPLFDIYFILKDWSMQFQMKLDQIDQDNTSLNSRNFKAIPENQLWESRNQNYSYRF